MAEFSVMDNLETEKYIHNGKSLFLNFVSKVSKNSEKKIWNIFEMIPDRFQETDDACGSAPNWVWQER